MARKADKWIEANIPTLERTTAVVTGGNRGIGFEVARGLAMRGAEVVLACRDEVSGREAAREITTQTKNDAVRVCKLDLGSRASITEAALELVQRGPIDILVNNAGVGLVKEPTFADEGFRYKNEPLELQLATNYLGHYALTGLVMPRLLQSPNGRIVNVTSSGHRYVKTTPADFRWTKENYDVTGPYNYSKLLQLQGTLALARKLPTNSRLTVTAAQPGMCTTDFFRNLPSAVANPLTFGLARTVRLAHSADMGALSVLQAAAGNNVTSGDLYSPNGPGELTGWPAKVEPSDLAKNTESQEKLWHFSEQATGIYY